MTTQVTTVLSVVLLTGAACAAAELIPNTLPTGYRQIEYVSFPKGAYVDTGLKPSNVQITTKFDVLSTYHDNMHVFGSEGGGRRIHFTEYSRTWYWGTDNTECNASAVCPWVGGTHELVYAELGTGAVKLDGATISSVSAAANGTAGYNLMLGCRGFDNNLNFAGKIYSFAVTNADRTAALDLVPAIRESDLLVGFYDRVSGRFLSSVVGRLDAARSHLEYERLTGVHLSEGAFFDTGLAVTNCEITMDYTKPAYKDNCHMFGNAVGGPYTQFTEWGYLFCCAGLVNGKNTEIKSEKQSPWSLGHHVVVYSKNGTATGDVVVDGKTVVTGTTGHNTGGKPLFIATRLGWPNDSYANRRSQQAYFEGEIHSFAVTNRAGVGLMNLVPCRRKDTGVVGFYDLVRSVFLTALGNSVPGATDDTETYEELPYVTFTEGAYVDLGYPVANVQITMKFNTSYVSDRHMFGQSSGASYLHLTEWGEQWVWGDNGKETKSAVLKPVGGLHEAVVCKIGSGDVIVDGTKVGTANVVNSTNSRNLLIGSRSGKANFVGDVYYFTVTNQDGTAVADLVPRRRVLDHAVGFLDRVSGKFYVKSGAGQITAALPTDLYEPAESVTFPFNGAFVDTGIAVPTNAQVTVKFEADYFNNRHVIGQEISNSFLHFTAFGNKWYWGCGANGGELHNDGVAAVGGVHVLVFQRKGDSKVVLDGTELGAAVESHTSDRPLLIGSRNGQHYFTGKIYYLTVTNNQTGACILDLQPCVRRADGKCGFFDAASGRFLTSPLLGYKTGTDAKAPTPDIKTLYYLKTNGAFIDTFLLPSDKLRVKATYLTWDGTLDQVLFGEKCADYSCLCGIGATQGATCDMTMGTGTGKLSDLTTSMRHVLDASVSRATVDGRTIYANAATSPDKVASETLRLFASVDSSVAEKIDKRRFDGKCYGFEAYENGVAVRNLVPAQRLSDGAVGLFDQVTGVFFTAQGGVFAAGPAERLGLLLLLK